MEARVTVDAQTLMVIFGGGGDDKSLGDLWELELVQNETQSVLIWPDCKWRERNQSGDVPPGRFGGAMTSQSVNGQSLLLLYGGCPMDRLGKDLCGAASPLQDLSVAQYSLTGPIVWKHLVQSGATLPFATWPTMETIAGSRLVVYGGYGLNATIGSRAERLVHYGNQTYLGTWNATHVDWMEVGQGPSTFGSSVLVSLNNSTLAVVGAPLKESVKVSQHACFLAWTHITWLAAALCLGPRF